MLPGLLLMRQTRNLECDALLWDRRVDGLGMVLVRRVWEVREWETGGRHAGGETELWLYREHVAQIFEWDKTVLGSESREGSDKGPLQTDSRRQFIGRPEPQTSTEL